MTLEEELVYLINSLPMEAYPTTIDSTGILPAFRFILNEYKGTREALELAERVIESLETDINSLRETQERLHSQIEYLSQNQETVW